MSKYICEVDSFVTRLVTRHITVYALSEDKKKKKTEDQIKEEAKAEVKAEADTKEFMAKYEKKITPAMKEKGIEGIITNILQDNKGIIEFSKDGKKEKFDGKELLTSIFDNLPSFGKNQTEFSNNDEDLDDDEKIREE